MLERSALRSRAHALAITAVLVLGAFAAIILASSAPVAPTRPVLAAASAAAALPAAGKRDAKSDAAARRASLPLYFEPNVGQSDARALSVAVRPLRAFSD